MKNSGFIGSHKEAIKKILYPIYIVYRYFTHDRHKKWENKNFLRNGLDVLLQFDKCLTDNGYPYTLAFGSCLGAVREKGFIPHDDDIDTWMWIDDYNPQLIECLNSYGFEYKWSFSVDNDRIGKQDTFIYKGVLVDIFYLYKDITPDFNCIVFANQADCSTRKESIKKHGGLRPLKVTLPISRNIIRVDFLGHEIPVPENYDEIMRMRYGNDYMVPQPKWNKNRDDKYHQYLDDKIGIFTEITK